MIGPDQGFAAEGVGMQPVGEMRQRPAVIVAVAQHGHQPDQFPVYDMDGEHDLAL